MKTLPPFSPARAILGLAAALLAAIASRAASPVSLAGEQMLWHKTTLAIDGPQTSETGALNPFFDYRLDARFTAEDGREFLVPGFYAADGQAADSGAVSGNQWRVRFTPDAIGKWTYQIHFRTGKNVATTLIQEDPLAGSPVADIDGQTGSFTVAPSDKSGPDFRNPQYGRLNFVGKPYLKFAGSDTYYLKAGQGSPETFIAYEEFDDVRDLKGNFLHRYAVHEQHFDPSALPYTWRGGRGKRILGSVNYLAQQGVNSQYVILTTVEGDGGDSWPWIQPDNYERYDCSKLDQWDRVFSYMNHRGVLLTCLLFECENEQLLDDGAALGPQRKVYLREIAARFAHLPGVAWIMSEETRLKFNFPADFNRQRIQRMRTLDPYDHPSGLHNGSINGADYADTPEFDYFSLHSSADNWSQAHAKTLFRVNEAKRRGHPWAVFFDECVSAQFGVKTDQDDPDHDLPRKHGLWGTLLAGGGGVSWYYGYAVPHTDLNCDDFTLRENLFVQSRIATEFFQTHRIPFWEMENRNDLIDSGRCLAKEGSAYVIQLDGPTYANIHLSDSAEYAIQWFDPKAGGALQRGTSGKIKGPGTKSLGRPPGDPSHDWITLVTRLGSSDTNASQPAAYIEQDGLVLIEAESLPPASGWKVDTAAPGFSGAGYLIWDGAEHHNEPGHGKIELTLKITTPGKYRFQWRNRVGLGDSPTDSNDSWLRFPNVSRIYGEKAAPDGVSRVYPKGLGKMPEPHGAGADSWFKVYSSRTTDWSWGSFVSDNDAHPVFLEFDEPGEYTLQISGRSRGHSIDRIALYLLPLSPEASRKLDLTAP